MRDRLGAVGGGVEITSHPGQGTLVAATAPLIDSVVNTPASSPDRHPTQVQSARSAAES